MTRTAPSAALTLAVIAAGVCFAPIRADAENFTRELEAGVQEIVQRTEHRVRRNSSSVMFKDMHAVVVGVGDQLLRRNEQMKKETMPVKERIPELRQLYFTEMRKLHDLQPDGASSVKYNERAQTLMCYHYRITSSGSSGGGGGGTFAHKLQGTLEFHYIERDPFALNLGAALSSFESNWRHFEHSTLGHTHHRVHFHGHSSAGTPATRSFLPGLAPTPAPLSPLDYPRGVSSMMEDIGYELTKLDVELSLKGESDKKRAKELRSKFLEVVQKFDNLVPFVQFDERAAELHFYDSAGNPLLDSAGARLSYQFPSPLMQALNMQKSQKALDSQMRLFMIGAAALVLLLFGGIYLAMRFSSAKDDSEDAAGE